MLRAVAFPFAVLAAAGFGGMAHAQETASSATGTTSIATVDETPPREDPFGLDGIAETEPEVAPPPVGFKPAQTRPAKIPEMMLTGIGRMNGDDAPTALLDIRGHGLFVVTVGDTISLQGLSGDNVMRIVQINDISVTVEAGSYGELIVVR